MAKLSSDDRNKLDTSTFAFPKQRKAPLNDASHVRNALSRLNQVQGVSSQEKKAARSRIGQAASKFGVEVSSQTPAKKKAKKKP